MFNKIFKSAPTAFITTTTLALLTISAGVVANSWEASAKRQCANHDWPISQHQSRVEVCMAKGYQVKLGPGF